MSFIRPEARAWLRVWREALIGGLIAMLGLYWLSGTGLMPWVGGAAALAGGAMAYTGVQRARFRAGSDGPGVVRVDEGAIHYFGPLSGGSISIKEVTMLALNAGSKPPVWVLQQPGQDELSIPVNAAGADALFEIFATLPGLQTEHMLNALNKQQTDVIVIWAKRTTTLH